MPKRSRSGLVSMPARVVAPTSVKGCRSSLTERAAGPSPIMMSIWKVLQRRVKDFLDHRAEAVDLVDEQHVVALRLVRIAARSRAFRAPGPEVWRKLTPSSGR